MRAGCALQDSDRAPRLVFVEPIQIVTGSNTGFASRAEIEVHLEGILLSRTGPRERNAIPEKAGFCGKPFVVLREAGYRREGLLGTDELLDERERLVFEAWIIECQWAHMQSS